MTSPTGVHFMHTVHRTHNKNNKLKTGEGRKSSESPEISGALNKVTFGERKFSTMFG
jgi:hypothetical protein